MAYKQGKQRIKLPDLVKLLKKNPKFVTVELLYIMAKKTLFRELLQELPDLLTIYLKQQMVKSAPPLKVKETVSVFSCMF